MRHAMRGDMEFKFTILFRNECGLGDKNGHVARKYMGCFRTKVGC